MCISVYVVEDYLLTRVGIKHLLEIYDIIKIEGDFESAEDCLDAMKEQPADVILMDIGLPGMNGIEATKKIKKLYPSTKIVILTSHEQDSSVISALTAGADAYCLKDADEEKLLEIIKTVYDGALWLAPQIAKVPAKHLQIQKPTRVQHSKPTAKSQDVKLTDRERAVLQLMIKGKSNPEIAEEILVSKHTAKAHVSSILAKLDVEDRVQAVVKAVQAHLI